MEVIKIMCQSLLVKTDKGPCCNIADEFWEEINFIVELIHHLVSGTKKVLIQ